MDFLYFYQNIPININPIAFSVGSFSIRWYALSYIAGFLVVYLVLIWRIRKGEFISESQTLNVKRQNEIQNTKSEIQNEPRTTNHELKTVLTDFLLISFFTALIGGRIGYVLLYNFSYFISNPLAIVSPFDQAGNYIGLYGMSYHGALLGIIIGSWIFLRIKKVGFLEWADFVVLAVPIGYFFGRIGNFLNGELYGRVTNSQLGMYFSSDPTVLRHPSQLYEAVLEGQVLFAILWKVRNMKSPVETPRRGVSTMRDGSIFAIYLIGYGILRFFAEFFREPDRQIGLISGFFTMGQILSLTMVVIGVFMLALKNKRQMV